MPPLTNKVAIVTGGGSGIGRAICFRFAREGARVVVADINHSNAKCVADACGNGAIPMELDVTSLESIEKMVQSTVLLCGGIDILINNAAIFDLGPVLDISQDSFDRIFSVNVKGLFFTLQAVARSMVSQKRPGKIINLASESGRRGEPLVSVYCASKAAVISLTQSSGLALIRNQINVNAISPGVVDTPMWETVDRLFSRFENRPPGEKKRMAGEAVPYGRMGIPDDLTGAAVFLASADSNYIVGQTLNVDGGNCLN